MVGAPWHVASVLLLLLLRGSGFGKGLVRGTTCRTAYLASIIDDEVVAAPAVRTVFREATVASDDGESRDNSLYRHGNLSLSFTKVIDVPNPSYVQTLKNRILSITSFSLLRKGTIMQYDLNVGKLTAGSSELPQTLSGDYLWPNELSQFVDHLGHTVTLIPDGFLLPGQNDGGLYAIRDPHSEQQSRPIRITKRKPGWFHHKAVHVRLPGGKEGILTARARKPLFGRGQGELVWLAMPPKDTAWHSSCSVAEGDDDDDTYGDQGLEIDTALNAPWEETVLAAGPDVMFEVVDLDPSDDCVEVIAAHFFGSQLSVHSLRASRGAPFVEVVKSTMLPTEGRPYGLCLATMPAGPWEAADQRADKADPVPAPPSHLLVSTHECAYDVPSALAMAWAALRGRYPRVKTGGAGSFRSGERLSLERGSKASELAAGGSLFAYELPSPRPASTQQGAGSTSPPWKVHTLFRGFKVRGWGGIFSPGAPGFPYVFNMPGQPRAAPLILLAGDCTGSAYIFAPTDRETGSREAGIHAGGKHKLKGCDRHMPTYELAFEVECGATVGSAAVMPTNDSSGDVEIFVPSYELNRVHAFRLHREDNSVE